MKKNAKKSEDLLGEKYQKEPNSEHEFFYCNKCKKNRRTNPIYYPESDASVSICAECYSKMLATAMDNERKNAEPLPEGTIIYFGKKGHKCNDSKKELEYGYYKLHPDSENPVTVALYRCKSCGNLIIAGNKYNPITYHHYKIVSSKQAALKVQQEKLQTELSERSQMLHPKYLPIATTDFLTRTTIKRCVSAQHDIEDIQAGVKVLRKDYTVVTEVVPALYCKTCNKYYLLETEYLSLKNKGILLCNIVEQKYWVSHTKNEFFIRNPESLLHKMGYNVSRSTNLYQSERHAILRAALDNNLLTKAEVLSHLDYLIRRSQGQSALTEAVNKWKQDREFVYGLNKGGQGDYYRARTIIHKSRR